MKLTGAEVAEQIRRGLRGEVSVTLRDNRGWDDAFAGDVEFGFGDWRITFFNDCDSLDYCDSAMAPDGRSGEYEDWCADYDGQGNELRPETEPTRCLLSADESRHLERMLKGARRFGFGSDAGAPTRVSRSAEIHEFGPYPTREYRFDMPRPLPIHAHEFTGIELLDNAGDCWLELPGWLLRR